MLQAEDLKQRLAAFRPLILDLREAIGYEPSKKRIAELEEKSLGGTFWDDLATSQKVLREIKQSKDKLQRMDNLFSSYEDALTLLEICIEENDEEALTEVSHEASRIEKEIEEMRLSTLLKGEYDSLNAIISFHPGAGGTEAQDWTAMLYRMYTRYAERHGFKCKVLDYLNGEEAGIKSACLLIEGLNAYGFLKSEAGVHRLVRISPFDTSGRRHTSFASLEVMPEIPESGEIQINPEDLKVDTYRASGAGGQHVNKTESAIRITHIPTGVIVACQTQRSQHQNREYAMKMLVARLAEIKEREKLSKIEDIKGVKQEIAWGSQIRSYVFMPYTLVKDHRTDFENGNIGAVMDGDIDGFINCYLKKKSLGEI